MKRIVGTLAATVAATVGAATLTTPWGEKVTSDNAWRAYPRPQLVRTGWTCLNGDWDYAVTSVTNTPGRPTAWAGKIRVPFALEASLSGVGRTLEADELLWYSRPLGLRRRPGFRTLLHFDGVDFRTMVFIGHREVTAVPHEGAQAPFTLDVTDFLPDASDAAAAPSVLTVCVWDPTEGFVNSRGKQARRPAGCRYTRVSGIWQSVWAEEVPESFIRDYRVEADIDRGEVRLTFDVESPAFAKPEVTVEVAGEGVKGTTENGVVTLALQKPVRLWSPETPSLYDFTATCGADTVKGYFGMRKFEKRRDANGVLRFYLNNRPCFLLGTLDQGWWPDGLLTPPSDEAMSFDVKTLKELGFNMMRKHLKVEPARYYWLCDTLGLLVVQDLPCSTSDWGQYRKDGAVRGYGFQRLELKRMMDGLQKTPSIVMWVPYNEGWSQPGEFLTHATLDFVRDYDPTRLVDGPSGCNDFEGGQRLVKGWAWTNRVATAHRPAGVCEAGDAIDLHLYRQDYPDGIRGRLRMFPVNGRRVSFLGEFGGFGQAVEGHLFRPDAGSWGYGGMADTQTRAGLEAAYCGLMDELADLAAQGLGGSVYTQTTDVELEVNGLMTYDRKVLKFDPAALRAAHGKVLRAAQDAAEGRKAGDDAGRRLP